MVYTVHDKTVDNKGMVVIRMSNNIYDLTFSGR